jgi:hypothetical protein
VSPSGLEDRCWRIGKGLFGFSPEGGIRTAGVRKPPDREPPATTLKPGGRHLEGRLDFICNANYYFLAIIHISGSGGLRTRAEKFRPPGLKTDASASGNKRGGVAPGAGGLRTPAEKCRPLGLKTDAGASGKKRVGGGAWGPVAYAHRQGSVALRA